jgi:hypothetical protein
MRASPFRLSSGKHAFASNADGTLTVIHEDSPDSYRVVQTLKTMTGSRNFGAAAPRQRPKMVRGSFVLLVVERR